MNDQLKAYKIQTNDFLFYFDQEEIDGVDLVKKSPLEFNCIKDHRSVNVVLLEADTANKKFKVAVDGEIFLIDIKDSLDQMLENLGFGSAVHKQVTNIKAPMPGLVLEINVTEGQQVRQGDKILILEAMKMENGIMSPTDAIIKKIIVSKAQPVDKGQVLIELE